MLVSVVGGGGSYPPPGYGGPSILVDLDGSPLLFDCGEDCLTGLRVTGYTPCDVDEVFISHIHIDHWAGIPQLAVGRIAEGCPSLKISVAEPSIEELASIIPRFIPRTLKYELTSFKSGGLWINGYSVELVELDHTVPTHGLIVGEGGSRLVSVLSDSRPSERIISSVRGSELILSEATLPSDLQQVALSSKHTTVAEFIDFAKKAGATITIAHHLSPGSLRELRRWLRRNIGRRVMVGVRGLQTSI